MLTLLEIYYLCIQYLQINISEAKGLFVSRLPLLCTAHRGLVKPDRNVVMWLLHLCLVCTSLLPGSAFDSS